MAMLIDSSGINLSAIYRPLNNIFLNKIMENIRLKHICNNQIKKGKKGTRELLNFLKKNFSVALMIDQRVTEGIKSDLFGKPALFFTSWPNVFINLPTFSKLLIFPPLYFFNLKYKCYIKES